MNIASGSASLKGLKKRKRGSEKNNYCAQVLDQYLISDQSLGNFPTPKELASLNVEILRKYCNLGLRAAHILKFAQSVESGKLNLKKFEEVCDSASYEKLYGILKNVKGFGPFASATVLMCIGYYEKVPHDTETIRHLSQIHAIQKCNKRNVGSIIKRIYGKYAPFQCLAYWLELLDYYEKQFGRLSELPVSSYGVVTGSIRSRSK
ncbi:hypothetical protein F0562_022514 [Nyssa sinensis]|uniref:HhH-GPD domain-containing protein n=1 Tax=Nyssa sinensis TaxID=561372 RepID=A0A5J5BP35_9ASTE|nr:hypothetical protein F0562_022514 [Nyssa sinensis]